MNNFISVTALILLLALSNITSASNPVVPEVFSPGVISGPADDAAPAFTPDGKAVYFTRSNGADYDIMVSHRRRGRCHSRKLHHSLDAGATWNLLWHQTDPT